MQKQILSLEDKITRLIKPENKTIHFDYKWIDPPSSILGQLADISFEMTKIAKVSAYTFNPNTGETFLLKEESSKTPLEALQKICDYVESNKENMDSFTVNWSKKENGTLGSYNTSYFYCHDITEVISKFFAGKSVKDYVIYEIKLNPIS
jgi:hypothetical protein